ncbi:hypothetical protein E2C01_019133 [Portunus trituberculatus]|uniref:Uncharacterized protein n=1 Tax=Portunus trituberculatus TaxID=210409 RepID=A0A5B7DYD3_PORTR|nr:hypothetical protein [Portunus trituberculatus]
MALPVWVSAAGGQRTVGGTERSFRRQQCLELAGKSAQAGKYLAGEGLSPGLGCAPSAQLPP